MLDFVKNNWMSDDFIKRYSTAVFIGILPKIYAFDHLNKLLILQLDWFINVSQAAKDSWKVLMPDISPNSFIKNSSQDLKLFLQDFALGNWRNENFNRRQISLKIFPTLCVEDKCNFLSEAQHIALLLSFDPNAIVSSEARRSLKMLSGEFP